MQTITVMHSMLMEHVLWSGNLVWRFSASVSVRELVIFYWTTSAVKATKLRWQTVSTLNGAITTACTRKTCPSCAPRTWISQVPLT